MDAKARERSRLAIDQIHRSVAARYAQHTVANRLVATVLLAAGTGGWQELHLETKILLQHVVAWTLIACCGEKQLPPFMNQQTTERGRSGGIIDLELVSFLLLQPQQRAGNPADEDTVRPVAALDGYS